MLKPTEGYYIIQTEDNKRYGAFSNNIHEDWNGHIFLKKRNKHPLGKKWKLMYLGERKVAFDPIDFKLPKSPINYVRYCENCGVVYIPFLQAQRFHSTECRVYHFLKQELKIRRSGILNEYNYQCCSGKDCPSYGAYPKLRIYWKKDRKPYCYKCFFNKINEKH